MGTDVFASVRLELESRPECVTLVRSTLAGWGEYLRLDPESADDLKTAVSEACNNVVLHAYAGGPGPLELSLELTDGSFDVAVRDHGTGIRRIAAAEDRMGIGLAVISALAGRAEFESAPGEGTEVRMWFTAPAARSDRGPSVAVITAVPPELTGDIVVAAAPVELLVHVMGRVVRAVAAGAHFAIDRFGGIGELTGAIGKLATATATPTGAVGFAVAGRTRQLELLVGPLAVGSAQRLFDRSEPHAALRSLLRGVDSVPAASGELLRVVVAEPRAHEPPAPVRPR